MDKGINVIDSLYDALDREPSSVHIYESLLKAWDTLGNEDMASGIASTLIQIDPHNGAARRYLQGKRERNPEVSRQRAQHGTFFAKGNPQTEAEFTSAEKKLEGYISLKLDARLLREEIEAVQALGRMARIDDDVISNLQAISDGRISKAVATPLLLSVRETARNIAKTPADCQKLIVEDFEAFLLWATCRDPPLEPDEIRERLIKRKTLLEAAIPESMSQFSTAALSQVERDFLRKKYVNSETMLGDAIEDIPKGNFFVSEDNYAWDLDELAQAIASNDGVMRNPLSRQMFTERDIRMIVAHPLGKRLKPLQVAQSQLKKGVRPVTIDRINKLGRIMLEDQSVDGASSRAAMDEFLAYVVTIPDSEQRTLNSLKIPAVDGHSGQSFDYTIGESVRDAKANTTCFHKVGDFLSQAAAYLRLQ